MYVVFYNPVGLLRQQGTQVDDACSLAALDALSFGADQARAAEWYNAYPNVQHTIPDSAVRRAASFFTPPPPPLEEGGDAHAHVRASRAQRMLDRMDAEALSAFSAVVYTALGSSRAAMSMISDIAKREIDWQLALLRPAPQSAAAADKVVQPWARNVTDSRKRKYRAPALRGVPEPRKRSRLDSGAYDRCAVSERSATPPPAGSRNDKADEGEREEGDDAPAGRLSQQRLAIRRERDLPLPATSERIEEESTARVNRSLNSMVSPCRRASQSGRVIGLGRAPQPRGESRTATRTWGGQFEPTHWRIERQA